MILDTKLLQNMANSIRVISADAVEKAKSGHPGMPLGMADVASVLFKHFLKFSPANPTWVNRDRFILSAGHGSMLLYSALYLTGYKKITLEDIKNFRQLNSITAGHPEIDQTAGIEVSTGPLGHGVSMAVGMAISEKILSKKYNSLINHKVYSILGDGCLMEGISYEALALAGHLKLNNLILIWDNNSITIDGSVSLSSSEDQIARMKANNFHVIEIDGHDYNEIYNALEEAQTSDKPVFIAAKTKIGFGAPNKECKSSAHGSPLGEGEIKLMKEKFNCNAEDFFVPEEILNEWRSIYPTRLAKLEDDFNKKLNASGFKDEINNFFDKKLDLTKVEEGLINLANSYITGKPKKATRVSSSDVLNVIVPVVNSMIGGSADLNESVKTKTKTAIDITKDNYLGNYINYGIREHAMGAIMNGISAYGGFIPYGGTFLIFSDFLRPSVRLSALMDLQVIYVFTHDSIGVGEDGPTHQPIETLPSLRLIPNLEVLRPADGIETIESYIIAIKNKHKPTAIILTRQDLPVLRDSFNAKDNKSAKGGYIIHENNNSSVNILASGSEVSLAVEVAKELKENHSILANVISVPSLETFKSNTKEYIDSVIKPSKLNVVIEAAKISGYSDVLLNKGKVLNFGIDTFGKSAKAKDLFDYFGLSVNNIVSKILKEI